MKYIVFETVNKDNGMIYVGIHKTYDPEVFDGYIGDGVNVKVPNTYNKTKTHLQDAVQRHGVAAFRRITLRVCDNMADAVDFYSMIVNEDFVKRPENYNSIADFRTKDRRPVHAFDLHGLHIMECIDENDAAKKFDTTPVRIGLCIKERVNYQGFYFSHDEKIDTSLYSNIPRGAICQYNRDGAFINSYRDIPAAATALDIPKDAIARAVSMRATCSGYRFLRADEDVMKVVGKKSAVELTTTVPVYRYKINGDFDAEFLSVKDAAENTPRMSSGKIIRAIKMNRVCRGYRWSYDKNELYIPTNKPEARKVEKYDKEGKLVKLYESTKVMNEDEVAHLRAGDSTIKYKKLS